MTPKVFAVSSAWLGPIQQSENPIADSIIFSEELLRTISSRNATKGIAAKIRINVSLHQTRSLSDANPFGDLAEMGKQFE